MKKSILALCALTLAAGLAGCGGGSSSHTVGGTVTGLSYGPLVLVTNGMEISLSPKTEGVAADIAYTFPNQLDYGDLYDVNLKQIGTDPTTGAPIYQQPPHQICEPVSGTKDSAGRLSTINAVINCGLVTNTVGGTITGLNADNLVLINGSSGGTIEVKKNAATPPVYPSTFSFATPVTYGQTYGVTVLTQPTGQTCTVDKGTDVMRDNPVVNIAVTCVNNPT